MGFRVLISLYYHLMKNEKKNENSNVPAETIMDVCPVGWGCRIYRLLLCRGIRYPPNECPVFYFLIDTKHVTRVQIELKSWQHDEKIDLCFKILRLQYEILFKSKQCPFIFVIQDFRSNIFIFIAIFTMFGLICPLAFLRCFLSNSYTELRTMSFI